MGFDFGVPSTVPQDLLLIQDLIGTIPPPAITAKHVSGSLDSSNDSIASTDDEVESEVEVEADLAPRDEDGGMSVVTSESEPDSDSEFDASSSSGSEEGDICEAPRPTRSAIDDEDEELDVRATATYLQTKNEIVDPNIVVPTVSEVEPYETLEKIGEITSIVGNIVIVRGFPVEHTNSLFNRALDAESLLVFEDRKVFGYIYETFGPMSQPLYQVKFNQHYPLDTDKVRLSREVFHVPQRSHFVFIDRLKDLRGSDASNIYDEEPAEDEVEFSDDEKEAAFRAQRKKRRERSESSRQLTPAPSRIHVNDVVQDTYRGSNPYDAHGPYDDDYRLTGLSRPPPVPYDDPYADVPTSDDRVHSVELGLTGELGGKPNCEDGGDDTKASRVPIPSLGVRGRGDRNRRSWKTSRGGYRHNQVASQPTYNSGTNESFPTTSQMIEHSTGCGQTGDVVTSDCLIQPVPNAWSSPEANNVQNYQQHFIQPHINPRFASVLGLNLLSGPVIPWAYRNAHGHTSRSRHEVDMWTVHGGAGFEGEGDTYRPM